MVFGQMNEPPGNRLRVALTGLTMVESFRDEGRDILLFIDNIYRFTSRAPRCRRCWADAFRGGLPADACRGDGATAERITSTKKGSITSIQAVYVPADDHRSVARDDVRPPDATVVLSRDIAALGIYPSVDPLDSTSRQVDPNGRRGHHNTTRPCRPCRSTRSCATSSRSWAWTSSPEDKLAVGRARKIQRFLSQPFHGRGLRRFPGKYVTLKDTIRASA